MDTRDSLLKGPKPPGQRFGPTLIQEVQERQSQCVSPVTAIQTEALMPPTLPGAKWLGTPLAAGNSEKQHFLLLILNPWGQFQCSQAARRVIFPWAIPIYESS